MRTGYKDVAGGGIVALAGLGFLAGAMRMRIGEAVEMGPGYFPMMVSGFVVLLGVVIAVRGLFHSGALELPHWRPPLTVLGGILIFGLLLEQVGLIPAIAAGIIIGSLGDPDSRPLETLLLAAGTALAGWLVFRVALGLQMPGLRWPAILG